MGILVFPIIHLSKPPLSVQPTIRHLEVPLVALATVALAVPIRTGESQSLSD